MQKQNQKKNFFENNSFLKSLGVHQKSTHLSWRSGTLRRDHILKLSARFSVGILLALFCATIMPIYNKPVSVEAESGRPTDTILTFTSINDVASVNLNISSKNGTFATSSDGSGTNGNSNIDERAKFSISTNNSTGYALVLRATDANLNGIDTEINTIASMTTKDGFSADSTAGKALNNKWGIMPNYYNTNDNISPNPATNTTNFYPVPANNSFMPVRTTNKANSTNGIDNPDIYTVGIGLRADYTAPAGTYANNTFILEYTANEVPIILTFDAAGGSFSDGNINTITYSVPKGNYYHMDTKTTSSTNTKSAVGAHKKGIDDPMQYRADASYYQDLVLDTDAPGPYTLTVYYAIDNHTGSHICVFDDISENDYHGCSNAISPIGSSSKELIDNSLGRHTYRKISVFKLNSKTARIYFRSLSSSAESVSYGYWAEFTSGSTNAQERISGAYLEPVKDNLVFAGWCNGVVSNQNIDPACSGAIYNDGNIPGVNNVIEDNIDLIAMWSKPYMQNFSCVDLNKNETITLYDKRDGESYLVSKLSDGNCWMLDNLSLGGNNPITLTPSDTNIEQNWTLPASTNRESDWDGTTVKPLINADYKDTTVTTYGAGAGKIGVYYNFSAAMAGRIDTGEYDICPKGWSILRLNEYHSIQGVDKSYGFDFIAEASLSDSGYYYEYGADLEYPSQAIWLATWNPILNQAGVIEYSYEDKYMTENFYYIDGDPYGFPVRCVFWQR